MSAHPPEQPESDPCRIGRLRRIELANPSRQPTTTEIAALYRDARLSLPAPLRLPLASFVSFIVGLGLGTSQGSRMAGLRFRAEHAHKLPTTTTGWYLYHKSKNYHATCGGLLEGVKMGLKVSLLATAMFGIEHMFDVSRGTKDLFNTMTASVSVAGAFSMWNRYSLPMAARATKTALVVGLAYGGLQDLVGAARGRRTGYIEFGPLPLPPTRAARQQSIT